MHGGEHLRLGVAGDGRGLDDRRVVGVEGAARLLLGEARVVDEQLGAGGRRHRCVARPGVAGDRHRAARPLRADHGGGLDPALGPVDGLAALEGSEGRSSGTPSRFAASMSNRPGRGDSTSA